jgi:hypothetical protein
VSVQQQASVIDWTRDSIAEQHIIGYRADQVGMQFAMTRAYRVGWIVPLLQGDRIQLRLADPASVSKVEKTLDPVVRQIRRVLAEPETLATVHPLARDGGQFYEYPRADSLRELTPEGDSIDMIRVAVTPRRDVTPGTSVFEGEVDLDARSLLLVDPQTGEPVPVSVPTKNLRATSSLGLRALSGAVYIGVALPIDATRDTQRGLRLVFGFGRDW